jgi:hypothetical protein
MALNAKKVQGGGPKAEPLAPENYPARLVEVLDLGLQNQRAWKGKAKPPCHEIQLTYELGNEFMKDEDGNDDTSRPRWVGERIPFHNLSQEKAKSTLRYRALDPTEEFGGDFTQLIGRACLVNIVQNDKDGTIYNNVGGVSPPIKGLEVPELVNDPKVFDMDNPDMDIFNNLPEWLKEKMMGNLEYEGSALQAAVEGTAAPAPTPDEVGDDDFPFDED